MSDSCPGFLCQGRTLCSPSIKYTYSSYSSHTHGALMTELVCRRQGVRSEVTAYPGLEFLCLPPPRPRLLALGTFATAQNVREKQGKYSSSQRQTDFTGRFSALLFYLALLVELFGDFGVLQPGGPFQTLFPLGMTHQQM